MCLPRHKIQTCGNVLNFELSLINILFVFAVSKMSVTGTQCLYPSSVLDLKFQSLSQQKLIVLLWRMETNLLVQS